MSGRDDAAVLIFATRYALGRRTSAPNIVGEALRRHSDWLSHGDVQALIRDIEDQAALGYGDKCDQETWLSTLSWLRARGEEGQDA